jgi:hypothetical protein
VRIEEGRIGKKKKKERKGKTDEGKRKTEGTGH